MVTMEVRRYVLSAAWSSAREAAEKFGGTIREFFVEALRDAWAAALASKTEKTVTIDAVSHDYNSRGRGETMYGYVAKPDGKGGYLPLVRADQLDGAIILSRAAYLGDGYNRSNARTSSTTVEVTLPVGTIAKDYYRSNDRHHCSETRIHVLTATGWERAEFIGNKRDDGKWLTVVEVSGRRIELA